jgi:hypothetical protein
VKGIETTKKNVSTKASDLEMAAIKLQEQQLMLEALYDFSQNFPHFSAASSPKLAETQLVASTNMNTEISSKKAL